MFSAYKPDYGDINKNIFDIILYHEIDTRNLRVRCADNVLGLSLQD